MRIYGIVMVRFIDCKIFVFGNDLDYKFEKLICGIFDNEVEINV